MLFVADGNPDITFNLTSIGGIIAITFAAVEVLKAKFQTNTGFGRVPVVVWNVLISCALCFLANKVLIIDGKPLLDGNWRDLLIKTAYATLSASGLHQLLKNPGKSVGESQPLLAGSAVKPAAVEATIKEAVQAIDQANAAGVPPLEPSPPPEPPRIP